MVKNNIMKSHATKHRCRPLFFSLLLSVFILYSGCDKEVAIEKDLTFAKWVPRAPMLTPRASFGTAVVDGKLYAIGGHDGTTSLAAVEMYDPETDEWTSREPMPMARNQFGIATVNGKIYCMGGFTTLAHQTGENAMVSVEEYDPEEDSWNAKTRMIHPRGNCTACVLNGKIYVMGGYENISTTLSTMDEYDPARDTWTEKADMPDRRFGSSAVAVDTTFYVFFGGWSINSRDGFALSITEYDPLTDDWTTKNARSPFYVYYSACPVNDKIYFLGGIHWIPDEEEGIILDDGNPYSFVLCEILQYNPETDRLITMETELPTARWDARVERINDQILVLGGRVLDWNTKALATVEATIINDPE